MWLHIEKKKRKDKCYRQWVSCTCYICQLHRSCNDPPEPSIERVHAFFLPGLSDFQTFNYDDMRLNSLYPRHWFPWRFSPVALRLAEPWSRAGLGCLAAALATLFRDGERLWRTDTLFWSTLLMPIGKKERHCYPGIWFLSQKKNGCLFVVFYHIDLPAKSPSK